MCKTFFKLFALFALVSTLSSCGYNSMVDMDEQVAKQWAQVQTAYQRRADLIPNLVATVQGAANFEKETLMGIAEAQTRANSIKVDPNNLTPEAVQQYQQAQSMVGLSLNRFMMAAKLYPDLQANQNFRELQSQIEGTENRISVERQKFNEVVQTYNSYIRSFPNTLYAGMFGFSKKGYFEADAGTEKAPDVRGLMKQQ